ncbi:hypothetical protein H8D51_01800, partial [bacterium]|nr:hypothetical protein [bacterium]
MLRTLVVMLSLASVAIGSNLQSLFPSNLLDDNNRATAWIYFSDRDLEPAEREALLAELETTLDPHCLTRRGKVMAAPCALELDLPLSENYVRQVVDLGAHLRQQSRWLNAISVEATLPVLAAVQELDFVRDILPVAGGRRLEPQSDGIQQFATADTETRLDYGNSFDQLQQIGVVAAHDQGLSGAGVRVMMLDTGFYKDHEAIPNNQIF